MKLSDSIQWGTDKVTLTFYNDNENGHKSFFDDNGVAQEVKGSFYFSGKLSNISTGDGSETKELQSERFRLTFLYRRFRKRIKMVSAFPNQ